MKILCFLPELGTDGITKIMMDIYKRFDSEFEIDFITHKIKEKSFKNSLKHSNIYEVSNNKFIRYFDEYNIMKKNNYDWIHVNGNIFSRFIECMIAKMAGIKKVCIHSHNSGSSDISNLKKFLNKKLKFLFIPFCDNYLTCSNLASEWLFPKKIVDSKKVIMLENGIDIDKFRFNKTIREKYRKEMDVESKFVICHIGRFEEQKNHEFLIDIFGKIYEKNKNAVLLLIGVGKLEQQIKQKVKNLNLEHAIYFLGVREDIENILQAIDVFILPSFFEGLPVAAIEAQASGVKTFLSDNITKEAKIIPYVQYISLNKGAEYWATEILKCNNDYDRTKYQNEILNSNFNIEKSSEKLQNFYSENLNKE